MNPPILVLILAGGKSERLHALGRLRTSSALPFGGKYRVIDFTLSNCAHSGLFRVGILTQYAPLSLQHHIGIGKPWDLDRRDGGVRLLPPYVRQRETNWYRGTADALIQNRNVIEDAQARHILVLSGDLIYKMDYGRLVERHETAGAALTIVTTAAPGSEPDRYGYVSTDEDGRVIALEEKPASPSGETISAGIYLFRGRDLQAMLERPGLGPDLVRDVVQPMIRGGDRVVAYEHADYWRDVGTIDAYYEANMELLRPVPTLTLHDPDWLIYTPSEDRAPAVVTGEGDVSGSLVAHGAHVEGTVRRSILFPGVHVAPGALVEDSIVMHDARILPGARLSKAIVDKGVRIGERAVVGTGAETPNREFPRDLGSGLCVIGKGSEIPAGGSVGRNTLVEIGVREVDLASGAAPSGVVVRAKAAAPMSHVSYAMILAGGLGSRLCLLSEKRAKPAVPFGGKYRIIDFTLSNCVNSGIFDIGILTQYRPLSLRDHIGLGRAWDLDRKLGGVELLQPFQGWAESDWYRGTADAVWQNWDRVAERKAEHVLVLSGDHVYRMDYRPMIEAHLQRGADVTVAITEVPLEQASQFGVVRTDAAGWISGFLEKPKNPPSGKISMGVYVFRTAALREEMELDAMRATTHDFGKNIVPSLVERGRVLAFPAFGYWQDIGTLDSYYRANLDLLSPEPPFPLQDLRWPIFTPSTEYPPARLGTRAHVRSSIITHGTIVNGTVERSVLFPGVVVEEGAVVRDSIVMGESWIGPRAELDRCILDKRVHVGRGARIGAGEALRPNRACPEHLSAGITIVGKASRIPEGLTIGKNVRVAPDMVEEDFPREAVECGDVLEREGESAHAGNAS